VLAETGGDPAVEVAVARVEVSLSKEEGIQLLERAAIQKVLAEHRLNLAGLMDPSHAIEVGRLLKADILLIVERTAPKRAASRKPAPAGATCRIRAVEVRSGVALRSMVVLQKQLAADPDSVTLLALSAAVKWDLGADTRHYVGLLGFRSEEAGRALSGVCAALRAFLLNDLVESPDLVVLEREQLRKLTTERDLTGAELSLRTSTLLLDGSVRQGTKDNTLEITASLRSPGNGVPERLAVTVPRDDMSAARKRLVQALVQKLRVRLPASPPANPGLEAAAFLARAESLLNHGEVADAGPCVEAALALDSSRGGLARARAVSSKIASRYPDFTSDAAQILGAGVREMELRNRLRRMDIAEWQAGRSSRTPPGRLRLHPHLYDCCKRFGKRIRWRALRDPKAWELWRELQRLHVEAYRDMLAYCKARAKKEKNPYLATGPYRHCLVNSKFWTEDPAEWRVLLQKALQGLEPPEAGAAGTVAAGKGRPGTRSGRKGRAPDRRKDPLAVALAIRAIPRNRGLNFSLGVPVPFQKPGAEAVEREIVQFALNRKSALIRIAACQVALGSGILEPTECSRRILTAYTEGFSGELARVNPRYVFPRDAVEESLMAIRFQKDLYIEWGTKLFQPMLSPEHADVFAMWESPFTYFLGMLEHYKEYEKADALAARAIDTLTKGNTRASATFAARFLERLKEARTQLGDRLGREPPLGPDPVPPRELTGLEARRILVPGFKYHRRDHLFLHGDRLYMASIEGQVLIRGVGSGLLRLTSAPLTGGRPTLVGAVTIQQDFEVYYQDMDLVSDGETLYLGIRGTGVVRFAGGSAKVYAEDNGLPTRYVTALARHKGKLYLGTGKARGREVAGTLTEFDPATGKSMTLCSSRSAASRSPLDGPPAYTVEELAVSPDGQSLWVVTAGGKPGLWKYRFQDGRFEKAARVDAPAVRRTLDRQKRRHTTQSKPNDYSPSGRPFNLKKTIPIDEKQWIVAGAGWGEIWIYRRKSAAEDRRGWVDAAAGYKAKKLEAWRRRQKGSEFAYRVTEGNRYGNQADRADMAVLNFTKAIALMPDCPLFYLDRAKVHIMMGNFAPAIADMTKAIELFPDFAEAYRHRSVAYFHNGRKQQAGADMSRALKITPWGRDVKRPLRPARPQRTAQAQPSHFASKEVAAFVRGLRSTSDTGSRVGMLLRLGDLGSKAREATPVLIDLMLRDESDRVRRSAARALGEIDAPAQTAVPALTKALSDSYWRTRLRAAESLGSFGRDASSAAAALEGLLRDERPRVRAAAAASLYLTTGRSDKAVKSLIEILESEDTAGHGDAAKAVAAIGPAANDAVPVLMRRLPERNLAGEAAFALGKIGPAAKGALALLRGRLKAEDGYVRGNAAFAIWSIGGKAEVALPVLTGLLDKPASWAGTRAVFLLGEMGPAARPALPALKKIQPGTRQTLARTLSEALRKIETASEHSR